MAEKPNLIWHSNAPWTGTGYGTQTALLCERLKEHYDLAISAFYGLEGNIVPWNGIPVLPGISQTHGDQTIADHAAALWGGELRRGLVMTLMDVWVLDPTAWADLNVCSWVPVDHQPVPRAVRRFFLNSGAVPIAMSKFGQEELADLKPLYVPHAVDTSIYKPMENAREESGLPEDKFIVGMVAANKGNPSRKCFVEAFLAFKRFHDKHPDAVLYMHCEAPGTFQGVHLPRLLEDIGVPREAVIWTDQYRATHFPHKAAALAYMFSSLDVLLCPSAGEGFGIPVIEAQACGTPVIVSDFSAQPELVGAGWTVEGERTEWTQMEAWRFRPSVPDIADALEQSYATQGDPAFAQKAVAKAAEYDIERVMSDHMLPALDEVAKRFKAREPRELKVAA